MTDVKVTVRNNGPLRIEGPIVLIDADGNEWDLSDRNGTVTLCRCGNSANKPFCDGTHNRIGFQAPERAVRQAEGG